MRWTVIYKPSAQNDLGNIWLETVDREAIANAADEIDRLLASIPIEASESRSGPTRVIIEPPLTVLFDLSPDDATVAVTAVTRWKRRK